MHFFRNLKTRGRNRNLFLYTLVYCLSFSFSLCTMPHELIIGETIRKIRIKFNFFFLFDAIIIGNKSYCITVKQRCVFSILNCFICLLSALSCLSLFASSFCIYYLCKSLSDGLFGGCGQKVFVVFVKNDLV